MNKIKIEIGQRATFKNGASFIHENKSFDLTALIGGSPYFVSIVTLKKGSEVVKNTFSRLMEGLIEKRGGKDEATFTPIRQTGKRFTITTTWREAKALRCAELRG